MKVYDSNVYHRDYTTMNQFIRIGINGGVSGFYKNFVPDLNKPAGVLNGTTLYTLFEDGIVTTILFSAPCDVYLTSVVWPDITVI